MTRAAKRKKALDRIFTSHGELMSALGRGEPESTYSPELGARVRVVTDGERTRVERAIGEHTIDDEWRPMTGAEILEHLPADSETWRWLRERGARRPHASGPSGRGTPSPRPEERSWRRIELRLEPDVVEALDELVARRGGDRAAVVAELILASVRRKRTS